MKKKFDCFVEDILKITHLKKKLEISTEKPGF